MVRVGQEVVAIATDDGAAHNDAGTGSVDDAGTDADNDNMHWGGFRVGGEVTPLEGDASGIARAIAPVANKVIHNPNMSAPKAPELAHTLTMAPPTPSMGGMGGGVVSPTARRVPHATKDEGKVAFTTDSVDISDVV